MTKTTLAKVVTNKGVVDYAVEIVKMMIERAGHEKVILRSDSEPTIWALKEAVRRDRDVEIFPE